jgi:hypothetical protein
MKRSELEKYLGKQVTVTLFDGDKISGVLYKYPDDPRYDRNYYTCRSTGDTGNSLQFRCSHVIKIVEVN